MIKRLYVHNYRCLENFEISLGGKSSILLIGKNGSGKTTVGLALRTLQRIARGTNRVQDLIQTGDLTRTRTDVPIRFVIEVELSNRTYEYTIAFELPEGFRELRVLEERLDVDGELVFGREHAKVHLPKRNLDVEAQFRIDWHLVALPIVQESSEKDPLALFKTWLANLLILKPSPSLITGDSDEETLQPKLDVTNYGAWFSGLLALAPSAYSRIDEYLKNVMPDFADVKNPTTGSDARSIVVQFANETGHLTLPFKNLSDGEKCFMICGLVLAANEAYGPLACFWDEPDNYLAISEVSQFVLALRSGFRSGGQFIATSHNNEAIRSFADEDTLLLSRRNRLEPTQVRSLVDLGINGDVVDALIRDDLAA